MTLPRASERGESKVMGFLDSPHWYEPVGGLRPATSPATDGAGTGATEPAQAQRRKKGGGWRLVFPLCVLKGPEESLQGLARSQ